jgi:DNA polymerase-4
MFYVQVARLEDPEGVGQVAFLLVGGSRKGRGVITSASYEAREFGVRSGMPTSEALRLCPQATVVPVSRKACARRSREIRASLVRLSPIVEAASIDEFYLDLSGTERLLAGESLQQSAWRIRQRVLEETEVSVSIGGATQKAVAKLATRLAKPGGVHVVAPGGEADFMRQFRLEDIPGVGPALMESLRIKGIVTVEDALPLSEGWLKEWLGEARGRWLFRRIRGVDSTQVSSGVERKSVSSERTFAQDLGRVEDLERELLRLATGVGGTLREKGLRARTITVKMRESDFSTRQASHTLRDPVETDTALYAVSRNLLARLRQRYKKDVRLLGVGASNLSTAEASVQLGFFQESDEPETDRERALSRVVDELRARFGEDAILPGRLLDD